MPALRYVGTVTPPCRYACYRDLLSLRPLSSQWSDQLYYLQRHRGFPWGLSHAFLLLNVLFMIACSFLAITKRRTEFAVGGLFSVIIAQSLGYGLLFDSGFFFRNLSVVGGLLMLLADAWATGSRKKMLPGLPALSEDAKAAYLQLAGRILLVFLFLGFVFAGEWSAPRIVVSIVALFGCGMVAIGFQTRWATWVLIAFLSVSNVVLNNWWSLHHSHPQVRGREAAFYKGL